jgi:hypothetical protein
MKSDPTPSKPGRSHGNDSRDCLDGAGNHDDAREPLRGRTCEIVPDVSVLLPLRVSARPRSGYERNSVLARTRSGARSLADATDRKSRQGTRPEQLDCSESKRRQRDRARVDVFSRAPLSGNRPLAFRPRCALSARLAIRAERPSREAPRHRAVGEGLLRPFRPVSPSGLSPTPALRGSGHAS